MPREKRPSLFQLAKATRRVDDWVQRRKCEKHRKKNRKTIDDYIKRIGNEGGGHLCLDKDGVCCFPYRKYAIVIEVNEDNIDICRLRTTVCPLGPESNEKAVVKAAAAMQKKDPESRDEAIVIKKSRDGRSFSRVTVPIPTESLGKSVLTIVPSDGVHMTLDVPIEGLTFEELAECLDYFLGATVEMNKTFSIAKTTPRAPFAAEQVKPEAKGVFGVLKCIRPV